MKGELCEYNEKKEKEKEKKVLQWRECDRRTQ